jgi:hypothetical protein
MGVAFRCAGWEKRVGAVMVSAKGALVLYRYLR